ncbi:polyprenyl diphosphate synthase [Paradesulfovibrio bizertensis]|uniref:Isoprenyl transferase n=1 Tax=Desulfobaculum bizertense DSM 18034 TaxID=1121442 RepID=A0A1T4VXG2_9BACT|nr:polyprenyl diphosphate synthase [Desulfobaculum bizertense]SKA69181.1 Undecaprenyl pyrophosphate synthetase [Desulfobaculum bizertense DSM 18034]
MDGNGRWATSRGLSRSDGHKAGTEAAKEFVTECLKLGVQHVTLYTFSRENWARPKEEISFLFDLLVRFMRREMDALIKQGIRLNIFGDLSELPFTTRQAIKTAVSLSSGGSKMTLNLALNYSGRDDIMRACKALCKKKLAPEAITEQALAAELYSAGQPDPDLVIRTSGELRLSNFLLWESAYSEFYFTETYWPDFDSAELHKALEDYASRGRRFGKTDAQLAEAESGKNS